MDISWMMDLASQPCSSAWGFLQELFLGLLIVPSVILLMRRSESLENFLDGKLNSEDSFGYSCFNCGHVPCSRGLVSRKQSMQQKSCCKTPLTSEQLCVVNTGAVTMDSGLGELCQPINIRSKFWFVPGFRISTLQYSLISYFTYSLFR